MLGSSFFRLQTNKEFKNVLQKYKISSNKNQIAQKNTQFLFAFLLFVCFYYKPTFFVGGWFFAGIWGGAWWCGDFLLTLQKISAPSARVARGSGFLARLALLAAHYGLFAEVGGSVAAAGGAVAEVLSVDYTFNYI